MIIDRGRRRHIRCVQYRNAGLGQKPFYRVHEDHAFRTVHKAKEVQSRGPAIDELNTLGQRALRKSVEYLGSGGIAVQEPVADADDPVHGATPKDVLPSLAPRLMVWTVQTRQAS